MKALTRAGGNVELAICRLFSGRADDDAVIDIEDDGAEGGSFTHKKCGFQHLGWCFFFWFFQPTIYELIFCWGVGAAQLQCWGFSWGQKKTEFEQREVL